MLRSMSTCSLILLAGCAATRTEFVASPEALASLVGLGTAPVATAAGGESAGETAAVAAPEFADDHTSLSQKSESLRQNRFTLKGGYYGSQEDSLDDGYILNAAWTRFFNNWLAVEGELGYLDASGDDAGISTDLLAVPLMVNARVNVPAWMFDIYGGLGIGTFYYDLDTSSALGSTGIDGWILAGNAFLGASLNIADAVALGLEAKYYLTDDISSTDEGLDAYAVMLTLGFSF